MVQSVEGSYEVALGDAPAEKTDEGGFFIAPSQISQNIVHHSDPTTNMMLNRWVFIDVIINDHYRIEYLYDFPLIIPEPERKQMEVIFNELFEKDDICDRMSLYYQMIKLLLKLGRPKSVAGNTAILKSIEYMHKNYRSPLNVSELARVAHMSESNFYAVFKKQFGSSPISYLNHYRLTLASDMLKQSDAPVKEIAEAVGFTDQLYFSKLFKRTYRVSPREYRNTY